MDKWGLEQRMTLMRHSISMTDLAKHLGVSPQYVSRVLIGKKHATQGQRERIEDSIKTMINRRE